MPAYLDIQDAIVIGGGITGLTCAYELHKRGFAVKLIEANSPGGLVHTEHKEGFTLECGPNVFLDKPAIIKLVTELGLESDIVRPRFRLFRQHVWFNNEICRVPKDPISFYKTKLVAADWKLPILKRIILGKVPNVSTDDCSVEEFLTPVIGAKAVSSLLAPAFKGIYGSSISNLSARTVFPRLWEAGKHGLLFREYLRNRMREQQRARVFTLRRGISSLISKLVEYGSRHSILAHGLVKDVLKNNGAFSVILQNGEALGSRRVFVTTSGPTSSEYLRSLVPEAAEDLSRISYVPLAVLHFSVSGTINLPEKSFGILFPTEPERHVVGVMFNSVLFPHVAPSQKHLLTVMIGGSDGRLDVDLSDEELRSYAIHELAETLGIKSPECLHITRWAKAIPEYFVGHHKLADVLRSASETCPGLYFAGTDLGLPGVPDRIDLAVKTAQGI